MNKEQAIEYIKYEINEYLTIQDPHKRSFQLGYVNGLNSAFFRIGLFTIHDFNEFQDLMTSAITSR